MGKKKVAPRPAFVNIRKEHRKQKRHQKKVNRREHYTKKAFIHTKQIPKSVPGQFVRRPVESENGNTENERKTKNVRKKTHSLYEILNKEREKDKAETTRLKAAMDNQRKEILVKANEEEDKVIKKLEKQLGLNKIKNKKNFFSDDGLDYLLEVCDRSTQEQIVAAEKHLANVDGESDFEEDLAAVTGKQIKGKTRISEKESRLDDGFNIMEQEYESDEGSDESTDFTDKMNIDGSEFDGDDDIESSSDGSIGNGDLSDDAVSHLSDDVDLKAKSTNNNKEDPQVWEDIYGRKRDADGNIIKEQGAYVPPHLRNKDSSSDKDLELVKRQIKSVLNKLTGTNLHWACTTIENLYSSNSRNSVNTALTDLWVEAIVQHSATKDRMVAEHAALVSILHANVGMEIGAFFLQVLALKFDNMMMEPSAIENKSLDNLVAAFSYLFSFKIFQASLLYDILNRLLDELTEKNIECVLVALRSVGGVMRKEEPLALRDFIQDTQRKVAQLSHDAKDGSRIKFLLEVLMAIKNNNLTKIPNYDPSYSEELKKATRGIIRRGNYVTPLNIRLEDLLKAEERGKWWVVGSAWEGSNARDAKDKANEPKPLANYDHKLLELARQQRMNTDIRRSIFCVLMTAEDYMDAFEKLQHLGLKGQQEREVVNVLLSCCLQEKDYNPYYAVLAQKLCDFERKYQLSIQFSIWDKIKELENLPKRAMTNLAQLLIHLFMQKGLPLSVLKIIEFSDLNKTVVKFMRQILLAVIMNSDFKATLEVFHRVSSSQKLHMFRESLRLFIKHFLIRNATGTRTSVLSDEEMATLKQRSLEIDKVLSMHESKLKL